jgi:RNA polymerase sigma-70 factor (ECF subfamily)
MGVAYHKSLPIEKEVVNLPEDMTKRRTPSYGGNRHARTAAQNGSAGRIRRGERPADDRSLLAALRRGTPEAAEALFERFHGKVYNLAMSILKNPSDAEEATQDVFLTVIQKAHMFKGNSALYSWIYRICVNACLMRLRGKRRAETVSIEEFMPVFTEEGMHASPVDDWSKEVERRMLNKELGQVIRRFTEALSEKYRVVFVLSDVEGLSNEETAEILGLTVPAVKSRLHRARLYLRERLSRYLREGTMDGR